MSTPLSSRYGFLLGAALLTSPFLSACNASKAMHSSDAVPASEGTVRATAGADGNTDVRIMVKHLADPNRVKAGATTYVVWFQPAGGENQNVGAMTVDTNRNGRFDGSSPHRTFQVSVTPETSGQASSPTNPPVFSSSVDRRGK